MSTVRRVLQVEAEPEELDLRFDRNQHAATLAIKDEECRVQIRLHALHLDVIRAKVREHEQSLQEKQKDE